MPIAMKYETNEIFSLETIGDQILHGFFEATNQSDYSLISKLYHPDVLVHSFDGEKYGPEAIIDIFKKWKYSFPDLQLEPLCLIQEADVLVVHYRGKGTFKNAIRDLLPTGKSVTVHGFTCFKCKEGQIVEHWARIDYQSLSSS